MPSSQSRSFGTPCHRGVFFLQTFVNIWLCSVTPLTIEGHGCSLHHVREGVITFSFYLSIAQTLGLAATLLQQRRVGHEIHHPKALQALAGFSLPRQSSRVDVCCRKRCGGPERIIDGLKRQRRGRRNWNGNGSE